MRRLYQLIRQRRPVTERTFQVTFTDPGVQAYAFTFGETAAVARLRRRVRGPGLRQRRGELTA